MGSRLLPSAGPPGVLDAVSVMSRLNVAVAAKVGRLTAPRSSRLLILIYHRVLVEPDPIFPNEIHAQVFHWQMELVRRHLHPVALTEGLEMLDRGDLPKGAVAVTFDDGYADNEEVALPILRTHGVPATFFVATGYLNGGRMWNDTVVESIRRMEAGPLDLASHGIGSFEVRDAASRREACRAVISRIKHLPPEMRLHKSRVISELVGKDLPENLMMTDAQVRHLADAGMDIGGHTVSHPILRLLSDEEAASEISGGRARLEKITGRPVTLFAYPNGRPGEDYGERDVDLVRRTGFRAAVSTRRGPCGQSSDCWQLPRVSPWDRTPLRWLSRLYAEMHGTT
jgi:peptidoglycan/xylan/chitin deacetylase (PgdA/CDA1 family)